jgi:hypothetical protein
VSRSVTSADSFVDCTIFTSPATATTDLYSGTIGNISKKLWRAIIATGLSLTRDQYNGISRDIALDLRIGNIGGIGLGGPG